MQTNEMDLIKCSGCAKNGINRHRYSLKEYSRCFKVGSFPTIRIVDAAIEEMKNSRTLKCEMNRRRNDGSDILVLDEIVEKEETEAVGMDVLLDGILDGLATFSRHPNMNVRRMWNSDNDAFHKETGKAWTFTAKTKRKSPFASLLSEPIKNDELFKITATTKTACGGAVLIIVEIEKSETAKPSEYKDAVDGIFGMDDFIENIMLSALRRGYGYVVSTLDEEGNAAFAFERLIKPSTVC